MLQLLVLLVDQHPSLLTLLTDLGLQLRGVFLENIQRFGEHRYLLDVPLVQESLVCGVHQAIGDFWVRPCHDDRQRVTFGCHAEAVVQLGCQHQREIFVAGGAEDLSV